MNSASFVYTWLSPAILAQLCAAAAVSVIAWLLGWPLERKTGIPLDPILTWGAPGLQYVESNRFYRLSAVQRVVRRLQTQHV